MTESLDKRGARMPGPLVMIRGAGDLGSGVAHRLVVCGFRVVMLEAAAPTLVRSTVAFGSAVFSGRAGVEGILARRVDAPADAPAAAASVAALTEAGEIAVLVDPDARSRALLRPRVVIDAMMAKRPGATRIDDAPLVIALGPGHAAGTHAHAVIETKRGHRLGRVITSGCAASDTGTPGELDGVAGVVGVAGLAVERVLRAPARGTFEPAKRIGEMVAAGETVGRVDGHPVVAGASGVLRGLLWQGVVAEEGMKIGDVDPRGDPRAVHEISDKARAVAGGVLEALLRFRDQWE